MVKQQQKRSRKPLIVFGILAGTILFLFAFTDITTLFSTQTLSLDATQSQGKASDRGVDSSTGIFRGKGFKGQLPPRVIGDLPPSTTDDIVNSRQVGETQGEGISGGGGAPASTIGLEGFQTLVRNDILVFDRFHTPAKGQTIRGTVLFEWGNDRPIEISQVLIPNQFFSWFEFDLPQTLHGEGVSFDGRSDDEFKYLLTVPENVLGDKFAVPIRFLMVSEGIIFDSNALIEIETPTGFSEGFSLAEFFRALFAGFRVGFD